MVWWYDMYSLVGYRVLSVLSRAVTLEVYATQAVVSVARSARSALVLLLPQSTMRCTARVQLACFRHSTITVCVEHPPQSLSLSLSFFVRPPNN